MSKNNRQIYTVSALNRAARDLLEHNYPAIWLQGEISNFIAHGSGHWYFSLKDDKAQISCAMFRNRNRLLGEKPASGQQVVVRGKISLYEARGNYQLIVEHMEAAGEGLLRQQFEQLKKKLDLEGLFAAEKKQALPKYPSSLAIITSATGAAIRDIISVLKRRFSTAQVLLFPAIVQGENAADSIVKALKLADQYQECDLIILARGGGSLEDLWAFNEEKVARAIFACNKPIITGIGHEIDFTIADFVADYRAPTPSAAAEAATPDQNKLLQEINAFTQRLLRLIHVQLQQQNQSIDSLQTRLEQQHPISRIQTYQNTAKELNRRLQALMTHKQQLYQSRLNTTIAKLYQNRPDKLIQLSKQKLQTKEKQLQTSMQHKLKQSKLSLQVIMRTLDSVSPLATMKRGYSILQLTKDHTIIRSSSQVNNGDLVDAKLAEGELLVEIKQIKPV